jgi:Ion channel
VIRRRVTRRRVIGRTALRPSRPARRPRRHDGRHGPLEPGGRYGLLLLLLITTYLLSASRLSALAADLQTVLFLGVLLLVLRTAQASRRMVWLSGAVALAGSAGALAAALTHTQDGEGAADLWRGLILLITSVLIVRRVLSRPTVTLQSIFGALSAYLILGLMFAAFFAAIQHLAAGSFFADHQHATTQTLQYFSFATLTTLGYGDFTAAGDGGRALAVIEALTGQIFLATLVARLVAAFRAPAEQAPATTRRRWPPGNARPGTGPSYHRKPPRSPGKTSPRDP